MEMALLERLRELDPRPESRPAGGPSSEVGGRFAELVGELVAEVNEKQNAAADDAEGLARGEVGIMDAVISLNEADLSLRMMMQIRDRALESYQRIMRSI